MRAACCDSVVTDQIALNDIIRVITATWEDEEHLPHAGQFYMLRSWGRDEGPFLSRPISLHSWNPENRTVEFLYEVKGIGTQKLAALQPGDALQLVGPAGNGFDLSAMTPDMKIALVGGGIGTAPMFQLAKELNAKGITPDGFFGFRDEPFAMELFRGRCGVVRVATDSGRFGFHGLVTEILEPEKYDLVLTCGPVPMMKGVYAKCKAAGVRCLVSMENKMACGIGACLGCTCHTQEGPKSVCKNGPVFEGSEVFEA
ncbi:MAG: dihydroorotate dehydrogenase electron transfer subunit [Oscillospiraceae bacterium]|nr:dihydroorotate dehydrogenase electron transfer subunit [Oscillospiraceae bacterium]